MKDAKPARWFAMGVSLILVGWLIRATFLPSVKMLPDRDRGLFFVDDARKGLLGAFFNTQFDMHFEKRPHPFQLVFDPGNRSVMHFQFLQDEQVYLDATGRPDSAFTTSDGKFFLELPPEGDGISVVAYDLETGKKIWETPLKLQNGGLSPTQTNENPVQFGWSMSEVDDPNKTDLLSVSGVKDSPFSVAYLLMKDGTIFTPSGSAK